MKAHSHLMLGGYLVQNYFGHLPKYHIWAFLFGCIQPDKNPATYLKGSLSNSWFRGHNWESSKHFLTKLSDRLEMKNKYNIFDFYSLGKLIHYTADAFTYAHNRYFPNNLQKHRCYENKLQKYFSTYIAQPMVCRPPNGTAVKALIGEYHSDYIKRPASICNDAKFSLCVCCLVVGILLANR